MQESARSLPQLYQESRENRCFTYTVMAGWLTSAVWESAVVFYVSVWTLQSAVDRTGVLLGMWSAGTLAYTLVATTVRFWLSIL